ncbi:MAG: hypothetical protein Q9191_006357 [Dirinaria sp. TL-2023a]
MSGNKIAKTVAVQVGLIVSLAKYNSKGHGGPPGGSAPPLRHLFNRTAEQQAKLAMAESRAANKGDDVGALAYPFV